MLNAGAKPAYIVFDGSALAIPLFRVVNGDVPEVSDFRSYLELGRNIPQHLFFRATGVSFYTTRELASAANASSALAPTSPRYG